MIKAVIFDMDGVLLDTEKHYCTLWLRAAHELGFDNFTLQHSYQIRSMAAEYAEPMLREQLGDSFDYYAVRERRRVLVDQALREQGIEGKPGAEELLAWLRGQGIKTAVATATQKDLATERLAAVGLAQYFDQIVSAKNVKHGKPAPDVYLYACAQIGEQPQHCIAVEDSPNGIQSAYRAGLRTVMVPDQTQPDEALFEMLFACVPNLRDMIEIVRKMGEKSGC